MSVRLREITIPEDIRETPELAAVVRHASDVLQIQSPPSGIHVAANWDLSYDTSRQPLFRLDMSDAWRGEASATFTLPDLRDAEAVERRLSRLWGDLLQDRSHKQLEHLRESLLETEEV